MKKKHPKKKDKGKDSSSETKKSTVEKLSSPVCYAQSEELRDEYKEENKKHPLNSNFINMKKGRLEAFSDGVIAIIITIMVLEIKVPHGQEISDLLPLLPIFLSYVLSFIYLGIYWNNHHHMMHTVNHVTGGVLWANLHLLFWLSLVPFATGWMGENHFAPMPMALYGIILLMAAISYFILQNAIIKNDGLDSILAKAVGKDWKGKASPILYITAIASCWLSVWLAGGLYLLVALMWLIPDSRIEHTLQEVEKH